MKTLCLITVISAITALSSGCVSGKDDNTTTKRRSVSNLSCGERCFDHPMVAQALSLPSDSLLRFGADDMMAIQDSNTTHGVLLKKYWDLRQKQLSYAELRYNKPKLIDALLANGARRLYSDAQGEYIELLWFLLEFSNEYQQLIQNQNAGIADKEREDFLLTINSPAYGSLDRIAPLVRIGSVQAEALLLPPESECRTGVEGLLIANSSVIGEKLEALYWDLYDHYLDACSFVYDRSEHRQVLDRSHYRPEQVEPFRTELPTLREYLVNLAHQHEKCVTEDSADTPACVNIPKAPDVMHIELYSAIQTLLRNNPPKAN